MTPHNDMPEPFILPARAAPMRRDSFKLRRARRRRSNMLANTFMRAPGEAVGTFALECAIDELAQRAGHGPDRAAHPQRAGQGPDHRACPSRRATSSRRGAPAPSGSAGAERSADARRAARGRMAGRHGLRDRDLSLLPHARRRGADHADARRPRARSRSRRTRWAWAPRPRRRRSPPSGSGLPLEQVTFDYGDSTLPGRRPGRRIAADRGDRRGGDRRAQRAGRRAAEAGRQRLAARRADGRTRSAGEDGGLAKLDEPDAARELRLDPGARAARRAWRSRPRRRRRSRLHALVDALARRDVLRGARSTRSPARRASAASSARSTAAASSTPRRRAASSAAASSWGSAWR